MVEQDEEEEDGGGGTMARERALLPPASRPPLPPPPSLFKGREMKAAKAVAIGPLTLQEFRQIKMGLRAMRVDCKQAGANVTEGGGKRIVWERIWTDLLPLRRPNTLKKLWKEVRSCLEAALKLH